MKILLCPRARTLQSACVHRFFGRGSAKPWCGAAWRARARARHRRSVRGDVRRAPPSPRARGDALAVRGGRRADLAARAARLRRDDPLLPARRRPDRAGPARRPIDRDPRRRRSRPALHRARRDRGGDRRVTVQHGADPRRARPGIVTAARACDRRCGRPRHARRRAGDRRDAAGRARAPDGSALAEPLVPAPGKHARSRRALRADGAPRGRGARRRLRAGRGGKRRARRRRHVPRGARSRVAAARVCDQRAGAGRGPRAVPAARGRAGRRAGARRLDAGPPRDDRHADARRRGDARLHRGQLGRPGRDRRR